MRCGYAFALIGGHLVAAGIDSQPSARAGRRGRKVGLGWRFGQRGHGSLVSIPVPPPRKLVGGERRREREEDDEAPLAAARGRATDRTPDLGSGRRGASKEEERRDDRQGRIEERDTCAMAAASVGVECSLRGQRQIRRSFGRCTRPFVEEVPVRGAKERVNASLGFGGQQAFSGGSFGLAGGSEALGDWRTRRGALGGAASLVGPFNASDGHPATQGGVSVPMDAWATGAGG